MGKWERWMMAKKMDRRGFLRKSLIASGGAGLALSLEEQILLAQSGTEAKKEEEGKQSAKGIPMGQIGKVKLSRLICGGNLINGYAHSRDLIYVSSLLQHYFTEEKIFETWQKCEENGINLCALNNSNRDSKSLKSINKYWKERGGKMQWIAQVIPALDDVKSNVKIAVDNGAAGAFVHGGFGDRWVRDGNVFKLGEVVEYIKENGLIAGIAGHSLQVPMACEKAGLEPDFYVKTFHPDNYWSATPKEERSDLDINTRSGQDHDNMWCIDAEKTRQFMQEVKKPWMAYKVLAAGAIGPREGFKFAYENGADFILAGMFDFQIDEDARIVREILAGELKRQRPWRG